MKNFTSIFFFFITLSVLLFTSFEVKAQMEFVQNKGQWDPAIKYKGDFKTGALFLENKGFTVVLHKPEDIQRLSAVVHGHGVENGDYKSKTTKLADTIIINSFAYKVKFLGASSNLTQVPDKKLPTHNNYFIGNDPAKWASDVGLFQAVTYQNIYPDIDIRYTAMAGI